MPLKLPIYNAVQLSGLKMQSYRKNIYDMPYLMAETFLKRKQKKPCALSKFSLKMAIP